MSNSERTPNRLAKEKSPYLLQHAYNPVDWYPWGEEAFAKAKAEDKPIFLSIGYSTCHWCHVMERESFEDEEVAAFLNRYFVSVKVDREERPDVDHIYMTVCQALTGHGGWPLSVFLTPDGKPFYAGTYFPKNDRWGMAGFLTILDKTREAWINDRERLVGSSEKITEIIDEPVYSEGKDLSVETIHRAFTQFKSSFDSSYGGFGRAPKFPTPHILYFLLRYWHVTGDSYALEMVEKTLDSMRRGGIYDHIGFGFSRYSTDRKWLVPHFEKMLYDNALLAIAYLEAFQATRKGMYASVAREIFTYVLRDMASPEGGFYSAEDADSEGMEGKFYVWTPDEVKRVLGEKDGDEFCKYYDITPEGNFEGGSIPNLIKGSLPVEKIDAFEEYRSRLFEYREKRIHPYKDDKILTAWNSLMAAALAAGGRILGNPEYTRAAEKAVRFILSRLVRDDGRLMARFRDGQSAYPAYAGDYAFFIWSLIELYETTYNPFYLEKALEYNDALIRLFWDEMNGGLFLYGSDSEQLITRPKEIHDGAMPSGNSVSALNFLRLARLTGKHDLEEKAEQQFRVFGDNMKELALEHAFLLTSFMFGSFPSKKIIVVGNPASGSTRSMLDRINGEFRPFTTVLLVPEEQTELKKLVPFIENYKTVDGKTAAYVCEGFSCRAPATNAEQLAEALENH